MALQNRVIIGLGNPDLWTIEPLGTNFSEILIKITKFCFMKIHLNLYVHLQNSYHLVQGSLS